MATLALPRNSTDPALRVRISVEQYLGTVFHPDREYVDGFTEERPVGEYEHGRVQYRLAVVLNRYEQELGVRVVVECRLQVRPDRFRIPDLMILSPDEKIDRHPQSAPLICIEILSPEDTWQRLRKVVDDYISMGTRTIWAFDPDARAAYTCDATGFHKIAQLAVPGSSVLIDVDEIFSIVA